MTRDCRHHHCPIINHQSSIDRHCRHHHSSIINRQSSSIINIIRINNHQKNRVVSEGLRNASEDQEIEDIDKTESERHSQTRNALTTTDSPWIYDKATAVSDCNLSDDCSDANAHADARIHAALHKWQDSSKSMITWSNILKNEQSKNNNSRQASLSYLLRRDAPRSPGLRRTNSHEC